MEPTQPKTQLSPYRRHKTGCKSKRLGVRGTNCDCPIWGQGLLAGKPFRKSLDTRNWELAVQRLDKIAGGEIPPPPSPSPLLSEAVKKHLEQKKLDKVADSTLKGIEQRLTSLVNFFPTSTRIGHLTLADLDRWRAMRAKTAPGSIELDLTRLRGLFTFARLGGRDWSSLNLDDLTKIQVPEREITPPFSDDERARLLAACRTAQPEHTGAKAAFHRLRAETILRVFFDTGLRISDVTQLRRDAVDFKTGIVRVAKMQKTGDPVPCLLKPETLAYLRQMPAQEYFFWNGKSTRLGATGTIDQTIRRIAKRAGVAMPKSHRFRHTFAAEVLKHGTIEQLAEALGHSDPRTTRAYLHLSPDVEARKIELLKKVHGISDTPEPRPDAGEDARRNAQRHVIPFPGIQKAG